MISRQLAVYPADTPLSFLRTAELLPIVTLRLFALPWYEPSERHPDWRDGMRAARIGETGIPAFHALFTLVATTPRRALDVRCRHCRHLGHDEGLLLRLISLLQSGWAPGASAILEDWLLPTAARMGDVAGPRPGDGDEDEGAGCAAAASRGGKFATGFTGLRRPGARAGPVKAARKQPQSLRAAISPTSGKVVL
jgi:hypothetical protein